ncbi:MAG: pyridoxamine 5'-phosphate oxidase [Proteobacteria bacterium]|nr:pyridoxamine 5'-phosphate oxidase [Pseudomonadota bacterium]
MRHHTELLSDPLPVEPLAVASRWQDEAWKAAQQPNPNAMVVATVDPEGQPSARVVLCKSIVPTPGYLVFFTNYQSRKGRQLTQNPRAAAVIHWDALHRQVRVEGPVVKAPEADSDAYFASRAWQSRLGAWASQQSEPIGSRDELQAAVVAAAKRFGTPVPDAPVDSLSANLDAPAASTVDVPRPPHWGGFRIWAESVELWVEGAGRIHDRARWTRTLKKQADGTFDVGPWKSTRLQP